MTEEELRKLLNEVEHLRKHVTELQRHNSVLLDRARAAEANAACMRDVVRLAGFGEVTK